MAKLIKSITDTIKKTTSKNEKHQSFYIYFANEKKNV